MLDFQPEFPRIINQNSPAIQLRTGSMPNFISPILFCREGKYEQPFFLIGRRCQSKDSFLAPSHLPHLYLPLLFSDHRSKVFLQMF